MTKCRTLPAPSITLALGFCIGIATAACTSEPQSPAAKTPENGGTSTSGGQENSAQKTTAETGGKTSSATKGSGGSGQGGTKSTGGRSGAGGSKADAGGESGTGEDTTDTGGSTSTGGSESSCVAGVNTGSPCDPTLDKTECVRSTRTCTCQESGEWSCTTTSGAGGATGAGQTTGAGGTNSSSGKTGPGGVSSGGTTSVGGTTSGGLGGGTSATTGNPTSNFCPENEPCRISPLGDSITEGMGWKPPGASGDGGGYRVKLFSLANADGKNFTFVGTRSNGPSTVDNKPFPQKHEGTSGITIESLHNDVVAGKGALTNSAVKPHIILLHIGTNNMYGTHPDKPEVLLAKFLDKIIADCPDALLVVAKLIPLPMNTSGVQSLNAAIPGLVEERAKKGAHIIMVDQFTGFPTSELGDQVHPNEAGYARMAGVWYKAISQYLH